MAANQQSEWEEVNNTLYKSFLFKDFSEAFGFMTKVALVAQQLNHHPTWTNTWNKVEIWLSTHSAGNMVTDRDRELAAKIDAMV